MNSNKYLKMRIALIICTFKRASAVAKLMASLQKQSRYPDEIIVVDSSPDDETERLFIENKFPNTTYYRVGDAYRGLTKQRNYGIEKVSHEIDIVSFLDDDILLEPDYFEKIIQAFKKFPEAGGIGGYILNSGKKWNEHKGDNVRFNEFFIDGWKTKLGKRHLFRKILGLSPDKQPGKMPEFSHGYSIGLLPPNGKIYPVDFFIGCAANFKKKIFKEFSFSEYFEGYGLYEDMDFCLRVSKKYPLYVHTGAGVYHYHEPSGRPNHFKYGKMVVRNGWYVWRVAFRNPGIKAQFKWHLITWVLILIRLTNMFAQPKAAFYESLGRIYGWLSLIFDKPLIKD